MSLQGFRSKGLHRKKWHSQKLPLKNIRPEMAIDLLLHVRMATRTSAPLTIRMYVLKSPFITNVFLSKVENHLIISLITYLCNAPINHKALILPKSHHERSTTRPV